MRTFRYDGIGPDGLPVELTCTEADPTTLGAAVPGLVTQAHEAIRDLEEAMLALRAKVASEGLFETMAQDYVDSIATIRGSIPAVET